MKIKKIYGYSVYDAEDKVMVEKEDQMIMLFKKRLFADDRLELWRIARILWEIGGRKC